MNDAGSADDAEGTGRADRSAGCAHAEPTLCHGTLRWTCDVCGYVSPRDDADRRARLQARLDEIRQRPGRYNRRSAVA